MYVSPNKGILFTLLRVLANLIIAQFNPLFNGIRSCEVRDNDEWSIDVANNKITHVISKSLKDRGEIIGAYCIVFRKGGEPTIEFADFKTYNKG